MRYDDPTGHFSDEEIRKYLENQLQGIADETERNAEIAKILAQWQGDQEWWAILANATYEDIVDGTQLNSLGRPGRRYYGTFVHQKDTFGFIGYELIGEVPQLPGHKPRSLDHNSVDLMGFHNACDDIIWARPQDSGWKYMGGTGYAKDGAPIQWGEYAYAVGHSAAALGAGVLGVGDLAVGTKGLGLAALVVFGFEIAQANENNAHFSRSIDANRRYWSWQ